MNMMPLPEKITRYRTVWISDVHLGTRGCKAEHLLDFLRHTHMDKLYLVGDIIDGWRLKKTWYWRPAFNDVVQEILQKVQGGTQVIYIPGNHDEVARTYVGLNVGGIEIRRDDIHETADGRRLLVLHGDEFDGVVRNAKWLAIIGDWAYNTAQWVNGIFNAGRRMLGLSYWSLSAFLKKKVKSAVNYIHKFETLVADMASRRGVEGVICGHIHHAEMRMIGDVLYCNDGDWVESCTALVETAEGHLAILHWVDDPHGEPKPAIAAPTVPQPQPVAAQVAAAAVADAQAVAAQAAGVQAAGVQAAGAPPVGLPPAAKPAAAQQTAEARPAPPREKVPAPAE